MKCTERKIRLSGEEVSFECDLLTVNADYGIVKYVIAKGREVDGLYLPDGTITLAIYYSDRSYNLYYWIAPGDETSGGRTEAAGGWDRDIAYYFNIAELLRLSRDEIAYRDLVVDVLVLPDGETRVLDEAELPANLDSSLRRRITETRDELLANRDHLIDEARTLLLPYARAL